MANQRLMKKVAPVVLSAAVAMTSMPATAFAADFSDTEVTVAEESADIEEASAEAADTDVVEDTDVDVEEAAEDVTEDEETSDEELFSAEVSEDEFADEAGDGQTEGEAYVLMNIPYDDFYKAELKNNDVKVDTFTSATKQKTRSSLAKGSYHVNSDGSDITGVTFPVKVSDISVLKDKKQIKDNASVSITTAIKGKETTTEYKGKDALFESDSYSYYVLSEEPSYYKELTVGEDGSFTFSAIEGKSAAPETKQVQAEFKTKSNHGDYQLKFDKTEFKSIINIDTDTVYGAVINTTDGTTYGLCHQENIWKGYELAWSTGYTTESNGCHLNSEHFESMIGKTIDSVTYYASNGIYTLDIADVKVLAKNSYVYAGLTWGEYWSQENVTAAGNVSGSDEKDSHNESDTGAFDAVTRATTNHGLHRGSYQCMATIYTTEGNAYQLSYWKSSTEPVLADGTVAIWTPADRKTGTPASIQVNGGAKESLDHYAVTGIKYVPVQVKAEDYADFAAKYPVVKNGEILVGGFSENNLKAYRETANVTVNTNGLKTVTKNEDGSFSFSARKTGTESGIQGTGLKVATGIKPEVKTASGSYGEFLRVDLNGNYGGLGAAMQAVKWDYYGNGNTVLATYGTKFAADNWMHKMMGIQLGLTHSVRCQLPAGTDGTGHWKLTVYALGYQDYTFEFDATATNIVTPTDPSTIDTTALKAALEKVKALNKDDYTEESWKKVEDEATETQEMLKEIEAAIKDKTTVAFSQAAVDEQVNEHLTAAINGLVKKEKPVEPVVTPDVKPTVTPGKNETKPTATPTPVVKPGITAKVSQVYVGKKATIKVTKTKVTGKVTFKSSNKKVATVNSKGVITGKKAGKAVITVKVGKYTKKLTVKVKKPSFKLVKSSVKLKKGKKTTIRVKAAPVSKVTYKTSNKKVATVNSKGVVTAKKKGTAKITVKCNGITRTFKVTVK
ncbi:penicillin-binding Tp47 domain C-containing protein [Blautia obeum]|uniref:penicillin-binding Tp47 domain C-containing protein n=1 Tax=Blautia obeum TaxID=40520 RepID=UPI0022E8F6FB|nr:penicillin-binding Tp47 domain C-containing protein [Blautia obeum]